LLGYNSINNSCCQAIAAKVMLAMFEQLMETILRNLMSHVVFLDDMIMIGNTFKEHLLNLKK
jgi:hypothetical protein